MKPYTSIYMKNKIHSISYITLRLLLLAAIILGLYGASRLSYTTANSSNICPSIVNIPACYLVLLAYVAMLFGFFLEAARRRPYIFHLGLAVATLFALPATVAEQFHAGTCPNNGGIPLCYLSLALCVLIGTTQILAKKIR